MSRFVTVACVLLSGWWLLAAPAKGAAPPAQNGSAANLAQWPTERVELLSGGVLRGFVESEDDLWIRLIEIHQPRGRPMYLLIRSIDRASVAKVDRLEPQQRAELKQRIDQFRNRSRIEAGHWQAIRLSLVTRSGSHYRRYRGKWFTLESTADEEMTRRMIVRVEQVFTAYRQVLAPRSQPRRPLRLVVLGSMDEYRTHLKRLGIDIRNPACFVREDNLVIAGSELSRLAGQLDGIRARHEQLREELERLEQEMSTRLAALSRKFKEDGLSRSETQRLLLMEKVKFQKQIDAKRKELDRCDAENRRMFDGLTHRMFARLYHEAFHAYLENYVYPYDEYRVPRWLNEGLAVMFEGGLLEAGTLRVDAPREETLRRLKADLAGSRPLSLQDLLTADAGEYLLHAGANRHYDYSWGLVYYLTFEKDLLASPELQRYVALASQDTPPLERFEELTGTPLTKFEAIWRAYIAGL